MATMAMPPSHLPRRPYRKPDFRFGGGPEGGPGFPGFLPGLSGLLAWLAWLTFRAARLARHPPVSASASPMPSPARPWSSGPCR